jgi:AbrB family looped-hinge helix DNA binding protein
MASIKEAAARIDDKGRVTLPKDMRKALGVGAGDTVFFRYDPKDNQLRIARQRVLLTFWPSTP